MLTLLLATKYISGVLVLLYIISSIVFYFSQNQSIWGKGPALYALAFQFIAFYVLLAAVIVLTCIHFFSETPSGFGWYYYAMILVLVINIAASMTLYVLEKKQYPQSNATISSYMWKSPTGVFLVMQSGAGSDTTEK